MALHNIRRKGTAAAAVIGLGALLVGCDTSTSAAPQAGYGDARPAVERTRLVRAASPSDVVTREVPPRTSYQPAPERVVVRQPKRSVKKSAIIIGSSAGVGAGIGAAVGGKKGAGIGALLGGGGAAVWDQITRRK
jgi:hypothetical protein